LFTEEVKDGDLSKVVQIANVVLQIVLEDDLLDSTKKANEIIFQRQIKVYNDNLNFAFRTS